METRDITRAYLADPAVQAELNAFLDEVEKQWWASYYEAAEALEAYEEMVGQYTLCYGVA